MQLIDVSPQAWVSRRGLQRCVALAVFLFLPLASLYASAGGVVFWALALVGVVLCFDRSGNPSRIHSLSRATWSLLLIACLLPVLLNLASVLYFGLPARRVSWLPFVGALFIVIAVFVSGISIKPLVLGATLASFVLLFITALAVFSYGHERPSLTMNALLYGKVSVVTMLITAWGLGDEDDRPKRVLMGVSLLAGLAALLLTGYRGGWLALPVVVLALWLNPKAKIKVSAARTRRTVFAMIMAVTAVAIVSANFSALERVQKLSLELQAYESGVVNNSSVGSRLAMWKSASRMYREHPLFGVGAHEYHAQLKQMQAQGDYPADAKLYRHAHNTVLNVAAEYGTIGLLVLLIAGMAAVRLYLASPKRYRQLGLLLLACWLLMALTNDVLAHQTLMRTMAFGFAVCLAVGLRSNGTPTGS